MFEVLYITDSMRKAVEFIDSLVENLRESEIENVEHDKENNSIIADNALVRGISIHESCLNISNYTVKYFIDGIDMMGYKDFDNERLDNVLRHIKTVMTQFREDTKQLSGKDELIEILINTEK